MDREKTQENKTGWKGKIARGLAGLAIAGATISGGNGCITDDPTTNAMLGAGLGYMAQTAPDYDTAAILGAASQSAWWGAGSNVNVRTQQSQVQQPMYDSEGRSARRAYGDITEVTTDLNAYENGISGIKIYVDFDVTNNKGWSTQVIAYFHHKDGRNLKDFDGQYSTSNGQVAVSKEVSPPYNSSEYKDVELFMPDEQLHLTPGYEYDLKFDVWLWDLSEANNVGLRKLDESDWTGFHVSKR